MRYRLASLAEEYLLEIARTVPTLGAATVFGLTAG